MLCALVAPRMLYVASETGDQWADPRGEFLSAQLASPVYSLLKRGSIRSDGEQMDKMPPANTPLLRERVAYHIREGKHDITPQDWQAYMKAADTVLK